MWCFAVIEWGSCQINSIGSFVINNATQKKYREFFVGFNVFYCFIKEAERSLTFILYCIKIYTFSTNPMKSIFLFSLIGFLLLVHRKALGSNDTVQLRVLSWNIQMLPNSIALFSKALQKKQALRAPWIVDHCLGQPYDLIVFQEVFDLNIKRCLQKKLKAVYPYQQNTFIEAGRLTSNGILIVSRYPIQYIDHVIYAKGVHEDAWAAKGCTLVALEKEGKRVHIAGTHLQAGNSAAAVNQRDLQFRAIGNLVKKHQLREVPLLVLGDMNTRRSNTEKYQLMLSEIGVHDTAIKDAKPYTIDPENSWNKGSRPQQLDYIMYQLNHASGQLSSLQINRLIQEHRGKVIDLADHYGVFVDLFLID